MITIDGQMDLCSGLVVAHTKGGATQLMMAACAPNPYEMDGASYRLVWVGANAEDFYTQHGAGLRSGTRLAVTGTNPRALIDRGELVIMLDVLDIQVIERASGEAIKIEAPAKPTAWTAAQPAWPWLKWVDHEVGA